MTVAPAASGSFSALPDWPETEWMQHTNAALKSYHSVLALARSPLADSALVRPLLVLDDVSPTATERGQALRLVLRWAVTQLAPERPHYPLGRRRPADDLTWQDPQWWRYNILRHRYIEPLHPDEFVEGGRITETLLGRMGIPSEDTYFDERNRAVREVAQWLQQQMRQQQGHLQGHLTGQASGQSLASAFSAPLLTKTDITTSSSASELRTLALEAVYAPVAQERTAALLLDIAATCAYMLESGGRVKAVTPARHDGTVDENPMGIGEDVIGMNPVGENAVFPQQLLLELARYEHLDNVEHTLAWLVRRRYLQAGDDDRYLWMSPVLQAYLYARQASDPRHARHRRAARYFEEAGEPLRAARHLQQAHAHARAATLLLAMPLDLDDEAVVAESAQLLARLPAADLPPALWREAQIRLADLLAARGERLAALAACRRGLQATDEAPPVDKAPPADEARLYRRMGKLYEKHNQLHALGYYDQAAALFPPNHPEVVALYKDRGWLHILRQSWALAEADLRQALALAPVEQRAVRADIDDALASLYRHQKRFDAAIDYARRALHEREALGDLLRVAHSFNNLGLIYNELGDFRPAIAAFEEALAIFERLHNGELTAGARLNIGLAHHLDGRLEPAVAAYTASLELCQAIDLPLVQARAHANLTEALLGLGHTSAAIAHWQDGLALSLRAGFDEEVDYYRALQIQFPVLVDAVPVVETVSPAQADTSPANPLYTGTVHTLQSIVTLPLLPDPESRAIVTLALEQGKVTPRQVMAALDVSKATATRRLAALAAQNALARHGEGRGAYYTALLPGQAPATQPPDSPMTDAAPELPADLADRLRAEYAIAALGVDRHVPTRWFADFTHLPDLPAFFRLEAQLGAWLGVAIDLKLYTEKSYAESIPSTPRWVWRAAPDAG